MVSRSFGDRVPDHAAVLEAMATLAISAREKHRRRRVAASAEWIFAGADAFRPEPPQHRQSRAATLPQPIQDTRCMLRAVTGLMETLDAINRRFGRGTAGFAATGWNRPRLGECASATCRHATPRAGKLPRATC